jgi:hypothetical protein
MENGQFGNRGRPVWESRKARLRIQRGARKLRGSPTRRLNLDSPALRMGAGKNSVGWVSRKRARCRFLFFFTANIPPPSSGPAHSARGYTLWLVGPFLPALLGFVHSNTTFCNQAFSKFCIPESPGAFTDAEVRFSL